MGNARGGGLDIRARLPTVQASVRSFFSSKAVSCEVNLALADGFGLAPEKHSGPV